MVIYVFVDRMT